MDVMLAKDSAGNMIGYIGESMVESDGSEIFCIKPHQSTEFAADFVWENGEWVEVEGYVFFHPADSRWERTEEPTM